MKKIYFVLIVLVLALGWFACSLQGGQNVSQPPPENSGNGGAAGDDGGNSGGNTGVNTGGNASGNTGETAGDTADETGDTMVALDSCALSSGTRVTWFDLSTFIFVPQSSYQMGLDLPAGEFDFEPAHQVDIGAFWMHETEVTNRQYANCVAAGQCAPPEQYSGAPYWFEQAEDLDDPVIGVTWDQADAYCQWIGARLPTEAEWELAARGVNGDPYPWGTDAPDCEHANYLGCLDPDDPQPVISGKLLKGASPFEMMDMAGNVNEWVHDWYAEDYYQNSPAGSPTGPDSGEMRVWRGGGYNASAEGVYSYLRGSSKPDQAQPDLGFRCAWTCGEDVPPNLCQMPPQLGGQPTLEREPAKPEVSGSGYCEWVRGGQSTGIVLSAPAGIDLSQYEISSPGGPLTCNPVGDQIVCYGPAVSADSNVAVTVCPDCQPGFFFDLDQGLCRPLVRENGDGMTREAIPMAGVCDEGYFYTEDCGCIPVGVICVNRDSLIPLATPDPDESKLLDIASWIATVQAGDGIREALEIEIEDANPGFLDPFERGPDDPVDPGHIEIDPNWKPDEQECQKRDLVLRCAPGTFAMTDEDGCRVCMPLRRMSDCPPGLIYDTDANCCIPAVNLVCPRLTYYDPISNSCIPLTFELGCLDLTIYVPSCGPKPDDDPGSGSDPECVNPRLYHSDEEGCKAAGCLWYQPSRTATPYCTYP